MLPMNQFMSEIPEPIWWGFQEQQQEQTTGNNNLTEHSRFMSLEVNNDKKEAMFEKPLTPSDVGKLNRLVIPKQHAEKHFPLTGLMSGEEKGLLLSLEDELGKLWRFRYSYWNSSQSYVLTRGWSRFVKDKRLDAGDIVVFERAGHRLFIGSRRRRGGLPPLTPLSGQNIIAAPVNEGACYRAHTSSSYRAHHFPTSDSCLPHAGTSDDHDHVHQQLTPTTSFVGSQKKSVLRLFGVNMEYCQLEDNRYSSSM